MSDVTRAEELVQTIERDEAFRAEVEAAPTMAAKRQVLDAHGFQDIDLDDMRAYVETKGGQLILPGGGRELTEQELASVAGGSEYRFQTGEIVVMSITGAVGVAAAAVAAA